MKMIVTWTFVRALLPMALVMTAVLTSAPLAAQQGWDACRCVDADGNEIENCVCFRAPRLEAFAPRVAMRGAGPRLGVSVDARQEPSVDLKGARLTDVLAGGPAEDAGLKDGDIIRSVAGQPLTTPMAARVEEDFDLDQSIPVQRLLSIVAELEAGQRVEVDYERDGQLQTTRVDVEELPAVEGLLWRREGSERGLRGPRLDPERFERERPPAPRAPDGEVRLRLDGLRGMAPRSFGAGPGMMVWGSGSDAGIELVELNPGLGAYFGAEAGVLVTDVARSSGLGLRPGDVVLSIGDRAVSTPQRFHLVLSSYGDDEEIPFRVLRDGSETAVTGRRQR